MFLPEGSLKPNGEYVLNACPACHKLEKFWFNTFSNVGLCFSCGITVKSHRQLLDLVSGKLIITDEIKVRRSKNLEGLETRALWCEHAWDIEVAQTFLKSRNISEVVARTLPIWWIDKSQSIAVDIDPVSEEFPESILYREVTKEDHFWKPMSGTKKKYYIWGMKYWQPKSWIILTEGIFDIISSGLLGHAVATLGSKIDTAVGRFLAERNVSVVTWYDPDEAGEEGRKSVRKALDYWGVSVYDLRTKLEPKKCDPLKVRVLVESLNRQYE